MGPGGRAGVGRGRGKGSGQVVMFARGHGRHGDGPRAPLGVPAAGCGRMDLGDLPACRP